MEDSNKIRKASEPTELIELVTQLKKKWAGKDRALELPQQLKQRLTDEILHRLKSLDSAANMAVQREAVESWRKEKLSEAEELVSGKIVNSTILSTEASSVTRALSSDWAEFSEQIGLWFPVQVVNMEHDDKPEEEEDYDEILPGKKLPPQCNTELHTDYGGAAVRWGLTHHKDSAYDCCMACLDQAKHAKEGEKKCNIWVYCPSETGCYSPDIYQHSNGECWLKYSEVPRLNFKDTYSESYRETHPKAPLVVPWVSGVVTM